MDHFKRIIGYEGLKIELERIVDVLNNPDKYQKLGVKTERGVMLIGEPGIGKTLFANEFLDALRDRHKLVLRKSKSKEDFIKEINITFEDAFINAPSVIFLDDLDKFSNNDRSHSNSDEFVAIQSLIDQYRDSDIFVIATSNNNMTIPKSLLRAGRLKEIRMHVPRGADAINIISHYIKEKKFISEIDVEEISKILSGSSCAEIENVINLAGIYAGYENRTTISKDDLLKACLRIIYNAPEIIDYDNEDIKRKVSVHEAGHTVAAELLEPNSVNIVSIKSYDGRIGGVTIFYQDESYWSDVDFMEHRVMARLAGKAATEIVFGKCDAGCQDDIEGAYDVVERFADEYCMYGFNTYIRQQSGDEVKNRKDALVSSKISEYYDKVKRLLIENKEFLIKVSDMLFENKVLTNKDIQNIKNEIYKQ